MSEKRPEEKRTEENIRTANELADLMKRPVDNTPEQNKRIIKDLADLMHRAADNPQLTHEELEHIVVGLRSADPHELDTAARGCPG